MNRCGTGDIFTLFFKRNEKNLHHPLKQAFSPKGNVAARTAYHHKPKGFVICLLQLRCMKVRPALSGTSQVQRNYCWGCWYYQLSHLWSLRFPRPQLCSPPYLSPFRGKPRSGESRFWTFVSQHGAPGGSGSFSHSPTHVLLCLSLTPSFCLRCNPGKCVFAHFHLCWQCASVCPEGWKTNILSFVSHSLNEFPLLNVVNQVLHVIQLWIKPELFLSCANILWVINPVQLFVPPPLHVPIQLSPAVAEPIKPLCPWL